MTGLPWKKAEFRFSLQMVSVRILCLKPLMMNESLLALKVIFRNLIDLRPRLSA